MSRNIFFVWIALLMFVIPLSSATGQQRAPRVPRLGGVLPPATQANFNPDVVTIWHKLGIPQSVGRFKRFRDTRINRDGLSPGKERKPPLLSIADPKNLAEGAPEMLQAAAAIKIDQDLAPQKLKALRYICSIGCSCYNKKLQDQVEKVLVEAMGDCTVDVRLAAIQVVLANAGNQCSSQGQCETCCSEGVVRKLKEVAFKMNDKGCYIEPNQQVRNLAQRALTMCPPLVEPVVEPPEPKPNLIEEPKTEAEGADKDLIEQGDNAEGDKDKDDAANPSLDVPKTDDDVDTIQGYFETSRHAHGGSQSYRNASSRDSYGPAWDDPGLQELQIRGVVDTIQQGRRDIIVKFVQSFELPVGAQVVIACDQNNASFGTVISSQAGDALISIDDYRVIENLQVSKRVRLGVLE